MNQQSSQHWDSFTNVQDDWWSQWSIAPVTETVGQHKTTQVQPQESSKKNKKKKKKKNRGNRKLQRYRAKLMKQGYTPETITKLINQNEPVAIGNNEQRTTETKRKRNASTMDGKSLIQSLSGISISQPTRKKRCQSTKSNGNKDHNREEFIGNEKRKGLPNYLRVPDSVFKSQLLKEVTQDRPTIENWLNIDSMLQYTRESARLTNNFCYWKMEFEFWQIYVTTAKNEALWLSQLSKEVIYQSYISWQYCTTEKNIEKRQKELKKKSEMAATKVNEHIQKAPPIPSPRSSQVTYIMNHLSDAIITFVNKSQKSLQDRFKKREVTLKLDIEDVRLMKKFYQQEPSEQQVSFR